MKLKNKLTGEINIIKVDEDYFSIYQDDGDFVGLVTLKELNDGWKDYYEEPKEIYFISNNGQIHEEDRYDRYREARKEIGNYFSSREEAEKAVEKLKAWKRLKDKGFHWLYYNSTPAGNSVDFYISDWDKEATRDLDLLFGGEE